MPVLPLQLALVLTPDLTRNSQVQSHQPGQQLVIILLHIIINPGLNSRRNVMYEYVWLRAEISDSLPILIPVSLVN